MIDPLKSGSLHPTEEEHVRDKTGGKPDFGLDVQGPALRPLLALESDHGGQETVENGHGGSVDGGRARVAGRDVGRATGSRDRVSRVLGTSTLGCFAVGQC